MKNTFNISFGARRRESTEYTISLDLRAIIVLVGFIGGDALPSVLDTSAMWRLIASAMLTPWKQYTMCMMYMIVLTVLRRIK